jgi:hypothetical protein
MTATRATATAKEAGAAASNARAIPTVQALNATHDEERET